MSPRRTRGPTRTLDPRVLGRFLASEWGLRGLALVLAVLVWIVVRGSISDEALLRVRVEAVPVSPERYAVYPPAEPIELLLRGPRAELEEARLKLGNPLTLRVMIPDRAAERESPDYLVPPAGITYPFRRSLVVRATDVRVEVHRLVSRTLTVLAPQVRGVPAGFTAQVEVRPQGVEVRGPDQYLGDQIRPDAIDVAHAFEGDPGTFVPPPVSSELSFQTWRDEQGNERYRSSVSLPRVTAEVTFLPTGSREIENRLEVRWPEVPLQGFLWRWTTGSNPDGLKTQERWVGTFEGTPEALTELEKAAERREWWYVVNVRPEDLPSEGEQSTSTIFAVEWARTSKLDRLRVRYVRSGDFTVEVRLEARGQ